MGVHRGFWRLGFAVIRRGQVVLCVLAGDYGKPPPGVVVQSNLFNPTHGSVVFAPITSHLIDAPLFRIPLNPTKTNGLSRESQIMTDKITAIRVDRVRKAIGRLNRSEIRALNDALRLWLNLD